MRELLDKIESRQQLVHKTAEELREQIAGLAEQLAAAEATLKRQTLAAAADGPHEGWVAEDCTADGRRRRATATELLAEERLCDLAPDHVLDALPDQGGERPSWAVRITPDGLLALRYRKLRTTVPAQAPAPDSEPADPALTEIELSKTEMEILRHFLALAPSLGGARTDAATTAVHHALPTLETGLRWRLLATEDQMDAIEAVFRLEALAGSSLAYQRFKREYRTAGLHRVRLTDAAHPEQDGTDRLGSNREPHSRSVTMSRMTSGPAASWHPGMTTAGKDDIRYMKPSQRNRYRRQGFTWAEIKKIDQAIGRGEQTITLISADREITLTLPHVADRAPAVTGRHQWPIGVDSQDPCPYRDTKCV